MEPIIVLSPLQGFTDHVFRNALHRHMGGVDAYYAPYIRLNGVEEIKPSNKRDLLPGNNRVPHLVPQVMTKDVKAFLFVCDYVGELGYNELNWNLGCPYPMVAKRGMGAGALQFPDVVSQVLEEVLKKAKIAVSVKMRLGYQTKEEGLRIIEVLNKFPVKEIIIHPRLGTQMYKGQVDLEAFSEFSERVKHLLVYNGDINSVEQFRKFKEIFPAIEKWMIGRGIIANPFLPKMIKEDSGQYPENYVETFAAFHNELLEGYGSLLSGDKHLIQKMYAFWEYFIKMFPNSPKGLKRIKKAKSISAYELAVRGILEVGRP